MKTRLWSRRGGKAQTGRRSLDAAVRIHPNIEISSQKEMHNRVWTYYYRIFSDSWAQANNHWLDAAQNCVSSHEDAAKVVIRNPSAVLTCVLRASSEASTKFTSLHIGPHEAPGQESGLSVQSELPSCVATGILLSEELQHRVVAA